MRPGRSLHTLLTINALLLVAVAWIQLSGTSLSPEAQAQVPPQEGGIPNAGSQRQRMIDELTAIRDSIDGLRKQFDGGKVKVTIANVDELRAATRPDENKGK